jgi:hypothetical protein
MDVVMSKVYYEEMRWQQNELHTIIDLAGIDEIQPSHLSETLYTSRSSKDHDWVLGYITSFLLAHLSM